MTPEIQQLTNSVVTTVQTHLTPQAAAYTFKEWAGVLGMIFTAIYSACHMVFMAVVHYGGLRKMGRDFMGEKLLTTTISAAPDKSDLPQPITAGQATGAAGK